jgi:hypothetical protein
VLNGPHLSRGVPDDLEFELKNTMKREQLRIEYANRVIVLQRRNITQHLLPKVFENHAMHSPHLGLSPK